MTRSSGILLPVSALPGPCGTGDLGTAAREFIDFLAAAGQRYWQILPLNPPDSAHSPYLSASTFAGSTDLLSPEQISGAAPPRAHARRGAFRRLGRRSDARGLRPRARG